MTKITNAELDDIKGEIENLIRQELSPHSFSNAQIDLSNASISGLHDNDGASWGDDVQLNLVNFRYQNYSTETRFNIEKESIWQRLKRIRKNSIVSAVRNLAHQFQNWNMTNIARRLIQSKMAVKVPRPKIEKIRQRVRQRLRWLELQYPAPQNLRSRFSPRYWLQTTPIIRYLFSERRFEIDLRPLR